jgi:hypothetical protein
MTDIDRIRNYLLERIDNGTFANYDNIAIFDELFLYETDDVIYVKRDLSMRYYLRTIILFNIHLILGTKPFKILDGETNTQTIKPFTYTLDDMGIGSMLFCLMDCALKFKDPVGFETLLNKFSTICPKQIKTLYKHLMLTNIDVNYKAIVLRKMATNNESDQDIKL